MTSPALNTSRSEEIFSAAQALMPGGVSSPVRAFNGWWSADRVRPGQGALRLGRDGNKYVDYIGSWGPAICGHAHPEVTSALQEAIEKGTSFEHPAAWRTPWPKW